VVRLTRIYTRTGDAGMTGLGSGQRASKSSLRVAAMGDVDEANAALGVAVAACEPAADPALAGVARLLRGVQNDLFDVGADLCTPVPADEAQGAALRIVPAQTLRLEGLIDEHNRALGALTSFVLPGGTPAAAALHVARTVVRRAERAVCALLEAEPRPTSSDPMRYLNRLSDLLFVLARVANARGAGDVLWVPGSGRGTGGGNG
jgi:cob(I)alamin adenosyltransferase